jgi:hypothetical protein
MRSVSTGTRRRADNVAAAATGRQQPSGPNGSRSDDRNQEVNDPPHRSRYEGAAARPDFGAYGFGTRRCHRAPGPRDLISIDPIRPRRRPPLTRNKGGVTVETPSGLEAEPVTRLDFGSYGLRWVWSVTTPTPKNPTR